MSSPIPLTPQGNMPAIGLPDSQDYPRLIFSAPYFEQIPIAEIIQPSVTEAVENILPSLVPQYVDAAAQAAVQAQAVLLVGSTMSGPLFLSPLMPTQPAQAATMAYVDSMVATAGIPEVPPVPSGQVWARETGQWVPITPQTGVFLPLAGGAMTGNINMSGNTIQNMAAVPAMPNGAAPAQWVLNQIASVSLYQGTWNADNNVPDLTQLSTHVNAYTWIAITTAVGGVVIGPPIPGLQGLTVFNGDTIIYSTVQGQFMAIHAGGLTLPEADERYVQLAGSQMSGALLLNANASQPLQAVTFQQLQTFVPPGAVTEAPNDGQLYGRNGLTASWAPVLPLAGGILTGALTLAGNATANLSPVPLQQMTSAISAATAGLLPLAGGTMTGLMTLSGNASVALNPVPLQQLNAMLGSYLPLGGGTLTGQLNVNALLALGPAAAGGTGNLNYAGGNLNISAPTSIGITTPEVLLSQALIVGGSIAAPNGPITQGPSAWGLNTISGIETLYFASGVTIGWTAASGIAITPGATAPLVLNGAISVTYGGAPSAQDAMPWGNSGAAWSQCAAFAFPNPSDPRLKNGMSPAPDGAVETVNNIAVHTFSYTGHEEQHHGFDATEVQVHHPNAIMTGEDEEKTLAINLPDMIAMLWKAVQELSAEVAALKTAPA